MRERRVHLQFLIGMLCMLFAGSVLGQGLGLDDGFPGQGGAVGGTVTDMKLSMESQGAGGTVLVTARIAPAEGYKVGQDTVRMTVEGFDDLQLGESFLVQNGEYIPKAQEYVRGDFNVFLPVTIPETAETGVYELEAEVRFVPCTVEGNLCLMPHSRTETVTLTVTDEPPVEVNTPVERSADGATAEEESQAFDAAGQDDSPFAGRGWLVAVLVSFALGFALLLTPCIYPLIPVTIALVGATAERSRWQGLLYSVVYVLGISVTYAVAGAVAGSVGGMFFDWMQHPAVSVALALIFVAMALAMFDAFTLDLSSQRLQRFKARLQGKGGVIGLFVIGILTGVGATACVAPVIASAVLYVGDQGSVFLGVAMFFSMAWGFGLPLVVLGTFTGLARAAPKPGAWMNVVKHALGLALLGVAVYYLGKSQVLPESYFRLFLAAFLLGAAVFVGAFDRLGFEDGWYRRGRKTVGLLLLAASAFVFVDPYLARMPAGPSARREVDWMELEPGGEVQMVAEANKPVLVDYWTTDCAACKKMMRTTFVDPAVVAESERFIFAKVDMTEVESGTERARQFQERYAAPGYPVVALYDSSGRLVNVLTGYVGPEEMLQALKAVE